MMTIYLSNESYCSLVLIRQLNTAWLFVFIYKVIVKDFWSELWCGTWKLRALKARRKRKNNKSITRFWYRDIKTQEANIDMINFHIFFGCCCQTWVRFQFAYIYKSNIEKKQNCFASRWMNLCWKGLENRCCFFVVGSLL